MGSPITSISKATAVLPMFILGVILITAVEGQYDTPRQLCGGWFKSQVNGTIRFNNTGPENDPDFLDKRDKVCIWTINPTGQVQYSRFNIRVQRIAALNCDASSQVAINHFNKGDRTVVATETWNCGGPQVWNSVPGTVIVVVFKTALLQNGTGFQLDWEGVGDTQNGNGMRNTFYSWGKSSVDPLPYFAAGFFKDEVSTFAFPKGNDTDGYRLEMTFKNITIDRCEPSTADCNGIIPTTMLVCGVQADGRLQVRGIFENTVPVEPSPITGDWGIFIIAWIGNFWGAGGRFELIYKSVRATASSLPAF